MELLAVNVEGAQLSRGEGLAGLFAQQGPILSICGWLEGAGGSLLFRDSMRGLASARDQPQHHCVMHGEQCTISYHAKADTSSSSCRQ